MDEKLYNDILNATGAIAEMAALFYTNIMKYIDSEDAAIKLTSEYIRGMMPNGGGKKQ